MSKPLVLILVISVLLSACGQKPSWEDEKVIENEHSHSILLSDEVEAVWTLNEGKKPNSGEDTKMQLQINGKGVPIENFDINHEKLLHLIIISKDLTYFNHIHPEYKGNGLFEITNNFPSGGDYRIIADFKPSKGSSMSKLDWVHIDGETKEPVALTATSALINSVDGNQVTLETNELVKDTDVTLTFTLTDQATKQPITDLQPYLGAIGHVVILSEDAETYVHVHAEEGQGSGPKALFETQFPKSGKYKIWGQFQRNNEVFTVSYVVDIP